MKNQTQYLKVIILLFITIILSSHLFLAQQLIEPDRQEVKTYTLKELQEKFNSKWDKYNVENGYYYENGKLKKAPGWKQFKRFEWYWEARVNPRTGEFPQTNSAAEYEKIKHTLKKETAYNENWTNLGVNSSAGGYAGIGRINCIAFHPTDANTFWVGSPSGGIWRTTDGGSSWTILNNNETVLGVSDIAITNNYATSNTLYIATGDRDGNSSSLGGGQAADNVSVGVYKSTNGGSTWTATGLTFTKSSGTKIMSLLMNPNDNNILIASVKSSDTNINGIWKSSDGGANWSRKTANSAGDLEFKPGDPNTVWGASFGFSDGYFFKSTDGGESWALNNIIPNGYRCEMAVTAASPNTIYIVASKIDSKFNGVYKSTDGGSNWVRIDDQTKYLFGYNADGSDDAGQGHYDITIAADPTNANTVFVGGVNTWKSIDGGVTWSCKTYWTSGASGIQTVHADKHAHAFQPSTNVLFEGNDGGIYKTTDGGTTWTDLTNGMVISQLYRLGVSQTEVGTVITGLQDNGTKILRSTNWTDKIGGDGMECIVDYTTAQYMYGTYIQGQIHKSDDYGVNFVDISQNIPGGQPTGAWVTPYSLDPATSSTLIAGFDKVWKTTDRGVSWTAISPVLSSTDKLRSLAIAPSNSQVIYTADQTHMWKTTDGGSNWTSITLPSTSTSVTYIAVKHDDPNTLWITYGGYVDGQKIYESTNGGSSWTNISAGLPNLPTMCVVQYKKATDRNVLFVGTDLGVYVKDGANNWASYNTGLPNVLVTELEIYYASGGGAALNKTNAGTDKLRASTYGRGLWETNIDAVLPVELTTFNANVINNEKVVLNWETATEINNYGFEIERVSIKDLPGVSGSSKINQNWEKVGFLNGYGNSNSPKRYSYTDTYLGEGTKFAYRLKQIDIDGSFAYSDMIEVEILPTKFSLKQNFPNPFNPSTKINFTIPQRLNVTLVVTNIIGEEVATLVNETKDAGIYEVNFDASNLTSGIYYYTLRAGNNIQTRKMLLLK